MQDRSIARAFWITFTLVLLFLLWNGVPDIGDWFGKGEEATQRPVVARGNLAADEKSTIELFEKTRDSVVFITTKAEVIDLFTRNVFTVRRGTGSGFIWDDAGHVITNLHVVENASEATVKLADGRSFRASLVGASREHDIAVLKIGVGFKRPPPVPVGASHDLKVGQKVFAIGNPFGLDWTLTTGIVSALDRSLGEENGNTIEHLIQTDAAINPGNSGGPLLDSAGRLIGITTAIYSPSGANAGIGFAVPVDTVNRVVPKLIQHGKIIRPALGIQVDEGLNARLSALRNTEGNIEGIMILRVLPDSAAHKAGLKGAALNRNGTLIPGDIIISLQGKKISSLRDLLNQLDNYQVGQTVKIGILREGRKMEIPVTLQAGS